MYNATTSVIISASISSTPLNFFLTDLIIFWMAKEGWVGLLTVAQYWMFLYPRMVTTCPPQCITSPHIKIDIFPFTLITTRESTQVWCEKCETELSKSAMTPVDQRRYSTWKRFSQPMDCGLDCIYPGIQFFTQHDGTTGTPHHNHLYKNAPFSLVFSRFSWRRPKRPKLPDLLDTCAMFIAQENNPYAKGEGWKVHARVKTNQVNRNHITLR